MAGLTGSRRGGRTSLLVLLLLAFSPVPANAQTLPFDEEPPRTIGVFGDSLADGLWIGLRRGFRRDARIEEVLQLSEVSTGLANYVYLDVAEKTRGQLDENEIDIAVVMFGSNDIQGIRDGDAVHGFRTPGWESVYRRRVRELIDQLHGHGAVVYWVGLPVMRSNGYNANTVFLNGIFREEAEAAGALFVSTRDVSSDAEGAYSAYLPDAGGTPRLMRADDGIHFTLSGYTRIAAPVVTAIEENWNRRPAVPQTVAARRGDVGAQGFAEQLLNLTINGHAYLCTPADPVVSASAERRGNGARP